MRIAIAAALLAATPTLAAEPDPNRWNLADMYPGIAEWNADAARVEAQIREIGACKGRLGESAKRFKACEDLYWDAQKRIARMLTYSGELLAEDTGAAASLELNQKGGVLNTRLNEASSFRQPELLKLGQKRIDAFLKQEKSLEILRYPLSAILRRAPHTLDDAGEGLVATFGLTADNAQSVYQILAFADLPWPTIKLSSGKEVRLDQAAYGEHRQSQHREDRRKVYDAFFGKWKEFERTFGTTYYAALKTSTVYAKVRKYPDSLTAALDGSNIPRAVYDTLIAQTNATLPTLHRYLRLRARMLGLKEMRYYDIPPPIVKSDLKFPIGEGRRIMLESLAPMGEEYVAVVKKGLDERWMDVYPRQAKMPGAHMAGSAYDVHPYLLLNYNDTYDAVSTLTHEWGHAIHSWLANKTQPFPTADYATFTAEIASTLNEALLLDYMLKNARSDDEKLFYLGSALENLRGTYYRQAQLAEFEHEAHSRVDKGEALTGEQLTKIYGDILKRYYGHDEGVVKIDDVYCNEWAYIPHFYSPYYVYQYSTSLAASSLFAVDILSGKPGAKERFLDLLRAGGSDDPYVLVKKAGVDLATPAPYQAVAQRMDRIMDEIEAILASLDTP
jgi:oligoendopeptidase F